MTLIRKKGCAMWQYQCSVNGKKWMRSTGCRDRKRAEAQVPKLKKLAALHREQPSACLRLKNAIVKEVSRIEAETSKAEAERIHYALKNFFKTVGDILLEKVTESMLKAYMLERIRVASKGTVHRELYSIVRMLKDNGYQVNKPVIKNGKQTRHRPFDDDELRLFLNYCEEKHRILFMLMLATGARSSELLSSSRSQHVALLKEEIDPEQNIIHLRTAKQKAGQEEKIRHLHIPADFMQELLKYAQTVQGEFVFPPNQSLSQLFDRILKRAGISKFNALGKKLTAHSFRHTYATRMAENLGNNPFLLKELMGHCQIQTTQIYYQPNAPEAVMQLPVLGQGGGRKWWKDEKSAVADVS